MPEFILKQWAGPDGSIWRYRRNAVGVVDRRAVSPGGMGYLHGLYETAGLPPEHAQQVEMLFMSPLDDAAAEAHTMLMAGRERELTDWQRSRWAGFLFSMWLRTRQDLLDIGAAVDALLEPEAARDVLGLEDAELPPSAGNQLVLEIMMKSIDDAERGGRLINMTWDVIDLKDGREFFVSDTPIDNSQGFGGETSPSTYVTVPISPTKLFVAGQTPLVPLAFRAMPERELVAAQNRALVKRAQFFVGARGGAGGDFIAKHFGRTKRPSLTEGMAERFRSRAAPPTGSSDER